MSGDDYYLGSDSYTKRDIITAIRDDPETWTGATSEVNKNYQVYNFKDKCIESRTVEIAPANIKLFKEALSNATDNAATTIMHTNWKSDGTAKSGLKGEEWKKPDIGTIEIVVKDHLISIKNGGRPIPLSPCIEECTDEECILPPFLVFGTTYSGTNNDKSKLGLGAGKNGIGAKVINVLSTHFIVEAGNNLHGQQFKAHWKDNMTIVDSNVCVPGFEYDGNKWNSLMTKSNAYFGENYVRITYSPDFERYGWSMYDYDKVCLLAQLANSASMSSRVTIKFSFQIDEMNNPMTVTFKYNKMTDYVKLLGVNKVISHEQIFWSTGSNYGQAKLIGGDISKLSTEQQKKIANNPMCMEDFPFLEMYMYDTPDNGKTIAYVNGNETPLHGIHVKAITGPISNFINCTLNRKGSKTVKDDLLLKHITLIVLCRVNQPHYNDQAKSYLDKFEEAKYNKNGPVLDDEGKPKFSTKTKIDLKNYSVEWFKKWKAFELIQKLFEAETIVAKKLGKDSKHLLVPKLDNANLAGTDRGYMCTLFIPEGDAAKDYPTKMINKLPGKRDYGGVLPLRGKPRNVSKMSDKAYQKSVIIQDLVKAVGLQENVDYTKEENVRTLRYGHICCIVDADVDGDHIKCLLINIIYCKFKSFLESGRFTYFQTPIIRVEKKGQRRIVGQSRPQIVERFYTEDDFDVWYNHEKNAGNNPDKYDIRYLKGLASSNDHDMDDDIINGKRVVILSNGTDETDGNMYVAFGKDVSDERKKWVNHYRYKNKCIPKVNEFSRSKTYKSCKIFNPISKKRNAKKKYEDEIENIKIEEDKYFREIPNILNSDLINYSLVTFGRGLPSIRDGLKRCQRQAIYVIENTWDYGKGAEKAMKINRLGARISERTHYKHGETSMFKAIMKMCQCFTGGNNIPFLTPDGSFGTRRHGGKDLGESKARYAFTRAEPWHKLLMDKKLTDGITKCKEEGEEVEPEFMPMLIPMALVNGVIGISTAYRTLIPAHNIFDIIDWYISACDGVYKQPPMPWYKGFIGKNIVHDANLAIGEEFGYADQSDIDTENGSEKIDVDIDDDEDANDKYEQRESERLLTLFLNKVSGQRMESIGNFNVIEKDDGIVNIHITELPIGVYPMLYRGLILQWIEKKWVEDFRDGGEKSKEKIEEDSTIKLKKKSKNKNDEKDETKDNVDFMLYNVDLTFLKPNTKSLKLVTSLSMSNMTMISKDNHPIHFNNIAEIMSMHFRVMLAEFLKLKERNIADMRKDREMMIYKLKLIALIDEGKIGTKDSSDKWEDEMIKVDIPLHIHDRLLSSGGLKVLQKNDISKFQEKIASLTKAIEEEMKKNHYDIYRERLQALREAFENDKEETNPKNCNPCKIASIFKK